MKEQFHKHLSRGSHVVENAVRRSRKWFIPAALFASIGAGAVIIAGGPGEVRTPAPVHQAGGSIAVREGSNKILVPSSLSMAKSSASTEPAKKVSGDPFKDDEGRDLFQLLGSVTDKKSYKDAIRKSALFRIRIENAGKGKALDDIENDMITYFSALRKSDGAVFEELRGSFNELLEMIHFKRTGQRIRID
jgi:hypothetical protein